MQRPVIYNESVSLNGVPIACVCIRWPSCHLAIGGCLCLGALFES